MLKSDLRKFACLLGVISSTFYSQALWANENAQEHDNINAEIGATLDENKIETDSDNDQLSNEQVDEIQNAYRLIWNDQSNEMPLTKDNIKELYHRLTAFRDSSSASKQDKAEIDKYLPLVVSTAKKMNVDLTEKYVPYTSPSIPKNETGVIRIVTASNQSAEASSDPTNINNPSPQSPTDKNSMALVEYKTPQSPAFLEETPWQHVTKDGKVITIGEDGKYVITDPQPQAPLKSGTIQIPLRDEYSLSSKYLGKAKHELNLEDITRITREIASTYAKADAAEKRTLGHDSKLLTRVAESAQSDPLKIEAYSLNHYMASVDSLVRMSSSKPAVINEQYIDNLEVKLSTSNAYLDRVLHGKDSPADKKIFLNAESYYQIVKEKNLNPQQRAALERIVNEARQFNSNFPLIIDIPKLPKTSAAPNIRSTKTTAPIRQHKTNETLARRNTTSSSNAGIKNTQRTINIIDFSRSSSALNE